MLERRGRSFCKRGVMWAVVSAGVLLRKEQDSNSARIFRRSIAQISLLKKKYQTIIHAESSVKIIFYLRGRWSIHRREETQGEGGKRSSGFTRTIVQAKSPPRGESCTGTIDEDIHFRPVSQRRRIAVCDDRGGVAWN